MISVPNTIYVILIVISHLLRLSVFHTAAIYCCFPFCSLEILSEVKRVFFLFLLIQILILKLEFPTKLLLIRASWVVFGSFHLGIFPLFFWVKRLYHHTVCQWCANLKAEYPLPSCIKQMLILICEVYSWVWVSRFVWRAVLHQTRR